MTRVLIVDDDPAFREMLAAAVGGAGYTARTAASGEEALAAAEREIPDLVFLDQRMGVRALSGLQTLSALHDACGELPVVMVTAYGDVQTAVAAMKAGALDFVEKPLDLAEVRRILGDVLGPRDKERAAVTRQAFGGIVPATDAMQRALDLLDAAARSEAPVLVTGESGTGKELAAVFVHERSARRGQKLIRVNCAAIPSGLLEAEMFGHAAGAFTGAVHAREGLFAEASGGTLLLDEIAEMDAGLQAKLLRVLQHKEYQVVGSNRTCGADARIIASTNRPIPQAIRSGALREDLYYRLAVFEVPLPPLRERGADVLPLARRLLGELAGDRPRRLSEEAESALLAHHWPGNVRELRNALERAAILARGGVIRPEHMPPTLTAGRSPRAGSTPAAVPRAGTSVHEIERALIAETLAATGGNRTRAAESLGMSRRALQYKLKRYGLGDPDAEPGEQG